MPGVTNREILGGFPIAQFTLISLLSWLGGEKKFWQLFYLFLKYTCSIHLTAQPPRYRTVPPFQMFKSVWPIGPFSEREYITNSVAKWLPLRPWPTLIILRSILCSSVKISRMHGVSCRCEPCGRRRKLHQGSIPNKLNSAELPIFKLTF